MRGLHHGGRRTSTGGVVSTLSTGEARVTYRYTATVNGRRRTLIVTGPRGLSADQVINELIDNDEKNYSRFYRGATEEDCDADREDELVEVYDWSELT